MTLFEVFTYGDVPFGNLSNNEVLTAVVSGLRPEIPPNCPQHIADILKLCWKENPLKRICAEVCSFEFLKLSYGKSVCMKVLAALKRLFHHFLKISRQIQVMIIDLPLKGTLVNF